MNEVKEMLSALRVGGDPIEFTAVNEIELELLLAGGVTVSDFAEAVDRWTRSRAREDWGYIRTVALARRAEILAIKRDVI